MSVVYMEVTTDELELPLIVTSNAHELARKCGITPQYLYNYITHVRRGEIQNPRFIKVVIDD